MSERTTVNGITLRKLRYSMGRLSRLLEDPCGTDREVRKEALYAVELFSRLEEEMPVSPTTAMGPIGDKQ